MATIVINDSELHKKIKKGAAEVEETMSDFVENVIGENLDSYIAKKSEEKKAENPSNVL